MNPKHFAATEKENGTVLVILGAGCSLGHGYPLAKDMRQHLKEFGDSLGSDAIRIQKLVRQTVEIFDQLHAKGSPAQTLDDLVWLVNQGKLAINDIAQNRQRNYRLVEEAKVAVAALFLSRERQAAHQGLPAYRNLMRRIFASEFGTNQHTAAKNTPYRVLTFNYDRLFELAYRQHFDYNGTETFYGPTVLNSGLRIMLPREVNVELDRFSFLKLHGSVGIYSYEDYDGCQHSHQTPDPAKPIAITDDEFFIPEGHGIHSNKAKPTLIVFPHEKDFLKEYPDNRFSFRFYIPEIWNAARHFAAQAKEIWLIGYSCPEPDLVAWKSLLEAAVNCERIVVQNPFANKICQQLRIRLPAQTKLFEPFECYFEDS